MNKSKWKTLTLAARAKVNGHLSRLWNPAVRREMAQISPWQNPSRYFLHIPRSSGERLLCHQVYHKALTDGRHAFGSKLAQLSRYPRSAVSPRCAHFTQNIHNLSGRASRHREGQNAANSTHVQGVYSESKRSAEGWLKSWPSVCHKWLPGLYTVAELN